LVATSRFDLVVQSFTEISASLPSITSAGASGWADFDNDGDLDVAVAGSGVNFTTIYRNSGGTFAAQSFNLPNRYANDMTWLDFDNDGDVDLMVSGWESTLGYTATNYFFRNEF